MSRVRRPKVITTSFRPPSAGGNPPLERNARPGAAAWDKSTNAAWDALAKKRQEENEDHDKWVAGLSTDAVVGAFDSLRKQKVPNPKTSEEWWIAKRFAALSRRVLKIQPSHA